MLTKKQFDILTELEKGGETPTQREISQNTGMSLGSVNKTLGTLCELGYVRDGKLTDDGFAALAPYRVKRAVVFAAGFGSRLVPITLNTPKPLIRVKGKRIIDSLLDALVSIGIEDIYLVRGYLGEQFDQLLYKYPTIKFIDNPLYNEANNISSAMCARHLLAGAYVCEADLLLYNPALITKYQYQSNYLGVPVDKTDDWCLYTDKNEIITKVSIGGENCNHMYGISYWSSEDGAKLATHIEEVFNSPGGRERYWDQVPLEHHIEDYKLTVRKCTFDDIVEIDTYNELKQIDETYI
ncbi:MAG: NTP transferase domain-containing protein [Clostridia bacterium]|nr:NTP transferase domain-containing protein [Clostridia bacterium]